MTSPWLLVLAGGVTIGALFGALGVAMWGFGVAVAALAGRRGSRLALVALAVLGAALGAVRIGLDATEPLTPDVVESTVAEVMVSSVPQTGPSGARAVVRINRIAIEDDDWLSADGDVLVLFRDSAPDRLAKGDRLRVRWDVSIGDGSGFGRFARSSGASGWATAHSTTVIERGRSVTSPVTRTRDLVTRRIAEAIPGDAGALMAGFVTGGDSDLSESTREAFDRTGMSHITAVSGSNVAVLLTIWFFFVPTGRLRRSLPALAGIFVVIWLYVLLVGMGPGAVRAGLLASLLLPSARMGRRPDPLTALLVASAIMLLVQPDFAHSAGFWLSLAASTAMIFSVAAAGAGPRRLLSAVVALVAAQLATLPIIVWIFGGWAPASVAANLIVGPIVAVVFPIAFMLAIVVTAAPWLGGLVGWLPGIAADVIIAIVESIAREASLLRLGYGTSRAVALVAVMSSAIILLMSGESRRVLARVAWRYPGIERHIGGAMIGVGLGVWLAVVVGSVMG